MSKKRRNRGHHKHSTSSLARSRNRAERAQFAWLLLSALGLSQTEVICKIGKKGKPLDKGHFCRFVQGEAHLSEEATQKL